MKTIVQSLLAVTISMASPHQLLATEEMANDDREHPAAKMAVPPPPPGPYMSMALKESPGFRGGDDIPRGDNMQSPFFKADMPWPEARRMPRQWMPDDGYHFAPPSFSTDMMRPAEPRRAPADYYAYPQQPWQPLPPPSSGGQWGGAPAPAYPYQAPPQGEPRYAPPQRHQPSPWMPLEQQRGW